MHIEWGSAIGSYHFEVHGVAIDGRGLAVGLYGAKLAKKAEKQKNFAKTFSLTKSYFSLSAQVST